ncbi:multiprotein bridging factor aMBF1 [Nanoarchaeota archaeon]
MTCDMCDSEGQLFKTDIEGAVLTVCKNCSKYGKVIEKIKPTPVKVEPEPTLSPRPSVKRGEKILLIRPDFSSIIKRSRERKGLKQDELAKSMAEKASMIHKLETGSMKPSISLARKFEKTLGITLVHEHEEGSQEYKSSESEMTVGDMLNVKPD